MKSRVAYDPSIKMLFSKKETAALSSQMDLFIAVYLAYLTQSSSSM